MLSDLKGFFRFLEEAKPEELAEKKGQLEKFLNMVSVESTAAEDARYLLRRLNEELLARITRVGISEEEK